MPPRSCRRHGYLDERSAQERSNEPTPATPVEAFAQIALAGGTFLGKPFAPTEDDDRKLDRREKRFSASHGGFDLHCAVTVAADDEGRERLVRTCARPPFAEERIEELKDGRVAYLMKTPRNGRTHRVMSPVEFLARVAILIPPPFFPLVRYHGVFAARSSWRALVTPRPPGRRRCEAEEADEVEGVHGGGDQHANRSVGAARIAAVARSRILEGELFATSSRARWAVLLRRTFGFDALKCPRCEAPMHILATVTEAAAVERILAHLGVRTTPLPRGRARDPTGQIGLDFDVA